MSLPPEYFANNYGRCALGEACHCVRNLGNWLGKICAQWEPTKATSFEELMAEARVKRQEGKNGRSQGSA